MPHIFGIKTIGSKVAQGANDLAGKVRHAIGRTGGKKLRSSNVVDTGKVTLAKEVQEKRFVTVQDRCAMVVESSIKRGCAEKQWAGRSRGAKTAGPTEEIQPIRSMSKPSPEAPQLQYEPTEGERQNQLNDVMEQLLSRPQDHPRVSPPPHPQTASEEWMPGPGHQDVVIADWVLGEAYLVVSDDDRHEAALEDARTFLPDGWSAPKTSDAGTLQDLLRRTDRLSGELDATLASHASLERRLDARRNR